MRLRGYKCLYLPTFPSSEKVPVLTKEGNTKTLDSSKAPGSLIRSRMTGGERQIPRFAQDDYFGVLRRMTTLVFRAWCVTGSQGDRKCTDDDIKSINGSFMGIKLSLMDPFREQTASLRHRRRVERRRLGSRSVT